MIRKATAGEQRAAQGQRAATKQLQQLAERASLAESKVRAAAARGKRIRAAGPQIVVQNTIMERAKDFAQSSGEYRAQLDASDPSNRFMRRRIGMGGSGDAHIPHFKLWWVRETSRHMVLNDDMIGQALMRLADNVVQSTGFRLVSQSGDDVLDREIEAMEAEWGEDPLMCDFYGDRTWSEMVWQAQFSTSMDGEIFGIPIDNGTVQLLEAERCLTYRGQDDVHYLGLDYDDQGKVIAYNFSDKPLGPYMTQQVGPTHRVAKRDADGFLNVYHVHDNRRVTQHRGIPWFHAAMVKAGMLDDLQFATVVKAQSAASLAGIVERQEGAAAGPMPKFGMARTQTTSVAPDEVGGTATVYQDSVRHGQISSIPKGWKFSAWTPVVPNNEHFEHVRSTMRQIGATISMPLELILLDSSEGNWSNMNNVLSQARISFRRWQKRLVNTLLSPNHRFQVRRWAYSLGAVARAKLADGSLLKHKYESPAWPYNNRSEESESSATKMRTGQASPRGVAAAAGADFNEIYKETVADRSAAFRAAIQESEAILEATGREISPNLLLGWDAPANTALAVQIDEQANVAAPMPGQPPAPAQPGQPPANPGKPAKGPAKRSAKPEPSTPPEQDQAE